MRESKLCESDVVKVRVGVVLDSAQNEEIGS
jgi:hypothetical protein